MAAVLTGVLIVIEVVVIFGVVTVAMSFAMSWVLTILVMRGMR